MEEPRKSTWPGAMKCFILAALFLIISIFPVMPEGFRNITALTFSYYFDESYRLDSLDVLLIRIVPGFILKTEITREDVWENSGYRFAHVFSLGPVISFTKTFYLDAVYGLGINSDREFSHKVDANLTQETETLVISFGARGLFSPSSGDYYILPSMSGAIYPVDRVRLFCKIFFCWGNIDNKDKISGSVWGEVAYTFTSLFTLHTGFTVSYSDVLGYSAIAGCKLRFSDNFNIKYFFQYFDSVIEYRDAPEVKEGIANGIIVDIRF